MLKRRRLFYAVLLAALVTFGFNAGHRPDLLGLEADRDDSTLRELRQGRLVGLRSAGGAHVWRGIPYAAPPGGALRWRAPQPPQPWAGTRDATEFGAACSQFAGPISAAVEGFGSTEVRGSEDRLFVDVYAPAFEPGDVPTGDERLPVMLWVQGGGNTWGASRYYDATNLAVDQRVVVVIVQYRLGMLGWFHHPALHDAEADPEDRSGNYGTLDTIASLRWIQENIEVFGGDPDRVAVFGMSAGGVDVLSLLTSPRAAGLFHGAIIQSSGGSETFEMHEASNAVDDPVPGHPRSSSEVLYALVEAEGLAADRAGARRLIAEWAPERIRAYLRSKSVDELFSVFESRGGMYALPTLLRDGHVLPDMDPSEALARGEYNPVPVVFGTARDEARFFEAFESPHLARLAGVPLWFKDKRMYDIETEYGTRIWKAAAVDEPAAAIARAGRSQAFAYRLDWDEEGSLLWLDLSELLGASHGLDIGFVFGRLYFGPVTGAFYPDDVRPAAMQLSHDIGSYWAQFAAAGDPGRGRDGDLPRWEAWEADRGQFMLLDTEAGGGLRMSDDTADRVQVLAELARDERLRAPDERCAVYASLEDAHYLPSGVRAFIGANDCKARVSDVVVR